jgi:hypothetical protein
MTVETLRRGDLPSRQHSVSPAPSPPPNSLNGSARGDHFVSGADTLPIRHDSANGRLKALVTVLDSTKSSHAVRSGRSTGRIRFLACLRVTAFYMFYMSVLSIASGSLLLQSRSEFIHRAISIEVCGGSFLLLGLGLIGLCLPLFR